MKYEVTGTNGIFTDGRKIKTFKTYAEAKAFIEKENAKKETRRKWHNMKIWEVLL